MYCCISWQKNEGKENIVEGENRNLERPRKGNKNGLQEQRTKEEGQMKSQMEATVFTLNSTFYQLFIYAVQLYFLGTAVLLEIARVETLTV